MNPLWSYALGGLGVLGIYLAGSKRTIGWAISLAAQPLWMVYAVVTEQWGFLVTPILYGSVYARNLWEWHKNPPAFTNEDALMKDNQSGLVYAEVLHDCDVPSTDHLPRSGEPDQTIAKFRCPTCGARWVYRAIYRFGDFGWKRVSNPRRRWQRAERRRLAALSSNEKDD